MARDGGGGGGGGGSATATICNSEAAAKRSRPIRMELINLLLLLLLHHQCSGTLKRETSFLHSLPQIATRLKWFFFPFLGKIETTWSTPEFNGFLLFFFFSLFSKLLWPPLLSFSFTCSQSVLPIDHYHNYHYHDRYPSNQPTNCVSSLKAILRVVILVVVHELWIELHLCYCFLPHQAKIQGASSLSLSLFFSLNIWSVLEHSTFLEHQTRTMSSSVLIKFQFRVFTFK